MCSSNAPLVKLSNAGLICSLLTSSGAEGGAWFVVQNDRSRSDSRVAVKINLLIADNSLSMIVGEILSDPSSHQQRHVVVRLWAAAPFANGLSDDCGQFIQRPSSIVNKQFRESLLTKLFAILIFRLGNSI